jgi:4-aminobutyrate--pyruvate transaminase
MNDLGNSPSSRDIAHVLHPYTNLMTHAHTGPTLITRGEGIYVYDEQGRKHIEGLAGLWCASFGFGEQALVDAAVEQMRKLPFYHSFAGRGHLPAIDLAEKLKSVAPGTFSKVFFANSGSEANDTMVKFVWYYNNAIGRPHKKKIISRLKGYHGVTVAAGSMTGLPYAQADFDLPLPQMKHTSTPHYWRYAKSGESEEEFSSRLAKHLEDLILAEGPDTVAAFIAEPVMGAGGVLVPPQGYFPKVQAVLRKYDVLMVADEVICGFGRTGNWWGSQTFDVEPDIVTCAKALSSAYLPISAVLIKEPMFQAFQKNSEKLGVFGHGFTYTAHPACAAVALRTLQLMEERRLVEHAREVSPRFLKRLHAFADHPLVGETRGVGLMGAVELCADKQAKRPFEPAQKMGLKLSEFLTEQALVVRPLPGDSMGFCPPLIITEAEIDEMFDRFERGLEAFTKWHKQAGRPAAAE